MFSIFPRQALRRLFLFCSFCVSFNAFAQQPDLDQLRELYSKAPKYWPTAVVDPSVDFVELGLMPEVTYPADNPFSVEKAKLGHQLFNDGRLSRSGQIACASCHDPDLGWGDGRKKSFGHNRQVGKRNAPSIENAAFFEPLFWDGRALDLEQQALMPIVDPSEMHFTLVELEQRLSTDEDYKTKFKQVFGDDKITAKRIAMAIATFQRTLTSRRSDFDAFLLSRTEKNAGRKQRYNHQLSDQALWGLHLFRTKAGCANCHHGPALTDNQFHNIGLTFYGRENEDLGRYLITGNPDDVGKFKTPGLRGVMNTKPWMHNGLFADMPGIIAIYNAGGVRFNKKPDDPLSPQTSKLLNMLGLSAEEEAALIAFLEALTAPPAGFIYE